MYVHTHKNAKPKKIYLTAMSLLLMFGTVASPTSIVGLQDVQAKTATNNKKISTRASSRKDVTSGLGYIKEFNTTIAGAKSKVYYEDKANSAALKYGKDTDGYLTFGGKIAKGKKFNPNEVTYFGGGKGSWYKNKNSKGNLDIHFVKDEKDADSGAGSTGVVYPNVAKYHNLHNRSLDTTPVSIKLTWVAGPKKFDKDAQQITFHTSSVGISAQGQESTDSFKVEYFTDTKCTKPLRINSSTGKPADKGELPKMAQTFKDIDNKQYIGLRKARNKVGSSYTKAYYDNGNQKKGQSTKVRPFNYSDYTKNGNLWTGGTAKYKDKDKNDAAANTAGGTISTNDPRGFITFNTNDQHVYDYGHGSSSNSGNNHPESAASTGALKDPDNLKNLPKKYPESFGNLWKIGANGSQAVRWQGEATKYVSDEGIVGATAGTPEENGKPGKHGKDGKAEWLSNITINGTDKPIYYGIVTAAAWPATYHKGDDVLGINGFGFADNEINPGLDIEYVKVYSQTQKGKDYYEKSYMFDTEYNNDTHKVKVTLKDKYAKPSSAFFNHRWTVVIKTKPNKNLPLNQMIKTADGEKLGAVINNTAQWITPKSGTPDVIRGGKIGGGTVQITTTRPVLNKDPEPATAHKYVYRHTPGSSTNAWDDDLSQNYDGGTVYPGQELKYQIRVHMPRLGSDQRFKDIQINDNPGSNINFTSSKSSSPSASSNEIVTFNGTAKVNSDAKVGDEATNTGTVSYTVVTRHTGREYIGTDDKGNPKYRDYDYETSSSHSMNVNTTHNRVVQRNIKDPIKTAYAVEDGRLYPLNQLEYGKKFKYVVRQEVGTRNVDTNGESFELTDNLPDSLKADGLTAKVYRLSNDPTNKANAGDKKIGAAKEVAIDDDTTYGVDVTNTEGTLKHDGNKFTWVGDPSKMPFKGETYTLVITGVYKSGGDKVTGDNDSGNKFEIANTGKSKIDGTDNTSNTIVVPVELVPPSLNKDIVAIHDDTTNEDITDFTQVLKPQDNYTITYRFTTFAGNEFDGNSYDLTDTLPDNMKIESIGKPKGYIMADDTAEATTEDDSITSTVETSGTGTNQFRIKNSKVKGYGLISVDVKTKVKGQGDWSNYYDQMIYNNGGPEDDSSNKATSSSYMKIPNEANEIYHNSDSLNARNSSTITFNMGVQMLKIKQYIAQDDANWTTDLKSSHYVPVADGKVNNSKKAVTTMLVIFAPNYLKDQKVDISDKSDNSKMSDNKFNSGGFERGASDLSLVDNDKAIAYKNDASKLEVPNQDLKPETDNANQTTSETVTKKDLPTPGQTYAYEQKYSPTTKFAEEYAKLDHMHNTFSSKVKFYDSTEHSNDEYKDINKTGIKLSNIYGYTMRMSKGTYSQDGKSVDIKTYGEQIGLAVDNDNKTNFTNDTDKFTLPDTTSELTGMQNFGTATKSKDDYTDASKAMRIGSYDESAEKQPIAIWAVPNGDYTLPQADGQYANTKYGHLQTLRLKSNVGQGESVKIGTDTSKDNSMLANINADEFWPSNSLKSTNEQDFTSYIGFGSGSARTMTKGHSVVVPVKEPSSKHKNDTISANRVSELKYEPYKQHILTMDNSIYRDRHKSLKGQKSNGTERDRVADVRTDFVKPNTVATNPAQFITYYDLDKTPDGFAYESKPAAQRTLREAYWLTAPKSMSAKAGYGLEMPYQLHSFTFGATPNDDTLEKLYQTNLQSKDAIFDSGNTKTANDERLGFSYNATQDPTKIETALNDKDLANKQTLQSLLDAIDTDDKKNAIVVDDDKWLNILPDYNLTDISFRFNNRMLDNGKQSFAKDNVMYTDYNKNIMGYVAGSDLVKGGFRNYLRDDLELTNYPLNLYSSTANRGLIDMPGFGVGYATSFDFTQDLNIYGTRMTTKNDHDSKDSDIIVQPAISGRHAFKHNDLGENGNEWLKHNDIGSLYKNSSKSSMITR